MSKYLVLPVLLLVSVFLMAGCSAPQQPSQNAALQNATGDHISVCSDKDCFIAAANDCNSTSITITESYGVMRYETTTDCAFTKTLVTLDDNEGQDMKSLLEGKNLTCVYQKGGFDPQLVNTLIEGTENCTGELKVDLARLIVFTPGS